MQVERSYRTIEEWEALVGQQIRRSRIDLDLDQAALAALADISIAALSNLERGKGSSLKTVVAVVRALDRTDWLEGLAPPLNVSPMQKLRARQSGSHLRSRVRARRAPETGDR